MNAFLPVANPVAFSIGSLDIMWYGICIVIGMLAALALGYFRTEKHGLSKDRALDIFITVVISGVIGARLYYVIFEFNNLYKDDLKQIFNIRNGGLAIHGAVIFGGLALYIACKCFWKENFWRWADLIAPGLALAQAIGRWGNYFNAEAYGPKTTLPWGIDVGKDYLVHPTFLYESIWCFLLAIFLLWFVAKKKNTFDGQVFALYAIIYSIERIAVEQLRQDSLMIGPFKQAQIIGFVIIALAIIFWYFNKDKGLEENMPKPEAALAAEAPAEAIEAADISQTAETESEE